MYKNLKENILSSAKEIALKNGIHKINIRLIAEKNGISVGTIYNYYATKTALLIAVIEDFWAEAFRDFDFQALADKDFYEKIECIYNSLYQYLQNFKTNWLEDMSLLSTREKKIGRIKEKEYFTKISTKIMSLINEDPVINNQIRNMNLSKERIAEFIFDNMLLMLKKGEKDIEFFIVILKKIMSDEIGA